MQYDPQKIQQLFSIARSPAGQQLISLLQQKGGEDLHKSMNAASKGDYSTAQDQINLLLKDPQIKEILGKLGVK